MDPRVSDVPVSKKPTKCAWARARARRIVGVPREAGPDHVEIGGVPVQLAKEALALAAAKLPIKTRFIARIREWTMKIGDVRVMSPDQLNDEILKLKKEQFNLRFQRATGQLENTSRVRQVRRDIARVQTVARQKRGAAPTNKERI